WLAEVVVRPGIQQLDDGVRLALRCQDQNRCPVTARSDLPEQTKAIQPRQHQVQYHEVVTLIARKIEAGQAILGAIDRKAWSIAQSRGNIFRQPPLVFNQQYPHSTIPP